MEKQRHYEFANLYLVRKSKKGTHLNLQMIITKPDGSEIIISAPVKIGAKEKRFYAVVNDDDKTACIFVRELGEYKPTKTEEAPKTQAEYNAPEADAFEDVPF